MKEELQKLIEQYGADAVAKAAAEALNKHVPTINTPVVTDEQLINTISQLNAAVTDILEAGRKNEETYQNKVELVRRARQLETSIRSQKQKLLTRSAEPVRTPTVLFLTRMVPM